MKKVKKVKKVKFTIYALIYKNDVVYVGKTKNKLENRISSGYRTNKNIHSIRFLCDRVILDSTYDVGVEGYYINLFKGLGCGLLNKRGGDIDVNYLYESNRINKTLETSNEFYARIGARCNYCNSVMSPTNKSNKKYCSDSCRSKFTMNRNRGLLK